MSVVASQTTVAREVSLTRDGGTDLSATSFAVESVPWRDLQAGEVRVAVRYLSLDPYQSVRLRHMTTGETPPCGVVGEVVESRSDDVAVCQIVTGDGAWSTHVVLDSGAVTVVEPIEGVPLYDYVGRLGLSGLTAYLGVTRVAMPEPGEKLVVSGAYGGVGQVACQVAQVLGADVVGLVGSDAKKAALSRLGVRGVNYRDGDWVDQLVRWAPDGVDVFFDNVWGKTAARVVELLRPFGRVALCGQISGLDSPAVPPLPLDDWFRLVTRSLTIRGFRGADFADEFPAARRALSEMYAAGQLKQDVNVVQGLDGAALAFEDMVRGKSIGKTIVDVLGEA